MEKLLSDMENIFDTTRVVWREAMEVGGDFSIADALGPDLTASLLNSPLGAIVPIQGALAGTVEALANRPKQIQANALNQNLPIRDSAGLHVRTRDIGAASRWIAAVLEAKLAGSTDPISSITTDMQNEMVQASGPDQLLNMSSLLAAVTLVGFIANFPEKPPANFKSVNEMLNIVDAATAGSVTPHTIQLIIHNEGGLVKFGGINGDHNNVIQGDNNIVAAGNRNRNSTGLSGTFGSVQGSPKKFFLKRPAFYAWLSGFVVAVVTAYLTWLGITR